MSSFMDGLDLARKAVFALSSSDFEQQSGYCQRFARQVFEAVYPERTDVIQHFTDTARHTMQNFEDTPFMHTDRVGGMLHLFEGSDVRAGDFLYKGIRTSGVAGHVGIVFHNIVDGLPALCVAENSSYHMRSGLYHITRGSTGNVQGAKGWRTLQAFGAVEAVVRFDGK